MRYLLRKQGIVGKVAEGFLMACGIAAATAVPAQAAYPMEDFVICSPDDCDGATEGTITWYNRTANLLGDVYDFGGTYGTTAIFEAFAGSVKIDSETRTANEDSDLGFDRHFNFTIGDTDLVGGIDRIKITLCRDYGGPHQLCARPVNYSRS
ncbi:hypothetical protein ACWCQ1_48890 [Streptomyces sp. NPDC002144]